MTEFIVIDAEQDAEPLPILSIFLTVTGLQNLVGFVMIQHQILDLQRPVEMKGRGMEITHIYAGAQPPRKHARDDGGT